MAARPRRASTPLWPTYSLPRGESPCDSGQLATCGMVALGVYLSVYRLLGGARGCTIDDPPLLGPPPVIGSWIGAAGIPIAWPPGPPPGPGRQSEHGVS